jgi:LPXTG-motif cell wall-anchored protein
METNTIVRIISGALAIIVLLILVYRIKRRKSQ